MFLLQLLLQHTSKQNGFQVVEQATPSGTCTGKAWLWLRKPMATDSVTRQISRVQNTHSESESEMQQTRHFLAYYCFGNECILVADNAWQIEIQTKERSEQLWKGEKSKHFSTYYCFRDTYLLKLIMQDKQKSKERAIHRFWMIQLHWEHICVRLRSMHTGIFMFDYNQLKHWLQARNRALL